MKRIAIFLPNLRGGGVEKMRLKLANEWIAAGFQVDFLLMQAVGELLSHVPAGCRVVDFGCKRLHETFSPLISYLRTETPDALLAAMWPLTFIAPVAVRVAFSPTRVLVSEHTNVSMTMDRIRVGPLTLPRVLVKTIRSLALTLSYRIADVRIAVSTGVARDAEAIAHLRTGAFRVIYNPAASSNSDTECAVPRSIKVPEFEPLILSVGNLKPAKDHATLIRSFARLPGSIGAHLCIVGEGPLRQDLEALADQLGVRSRVHLPGFQVPAPYMERASVFALSSTREGFGNVLVEALEHGLPIVSTDCPSGPIEILQGGTYGRLVPVGDVAALADALAQTLSEEVDRERQRERARAFTPRRIAQEYLEALFPAALQSVDPSIP